MSTLLSTQSLSYDVASGSLFDGISFTLRKGDRIGLIGNNGCGKSTLLKLLNKELSHYIGSISFASQCKLALIEQHFPKHLLNLSMLDAVIANLPRDQQQTDEWRAEILLSNMGFDEQYWGQTINTLSGGQHARVLIARALIKSPDVLLLDEPSNHLDLPTLLWLEQFLIEWKGTFVMVSHDQRLLDKVTNCTWVMRDKKLHFFRLICSKARRTLAENDQADAVRYDAEQKEINRIEKSANRLAIWGRDFDNENLSRKAKNMEKRAENLKLSQTQLGGMEPWKLRLSGEAMKADRLLELESVSVSPTPQNDPLFNILFQQVKSGDRVAVTGKNGMGKSSLLRMLWLNYQSVKSNTDSIEQAYFHTQAHVGYYDQSLDQLCDNDLLLDALYPFYPESQEVRKMALISAGFSYGRHNQRVAELSGGERSRLLFVGLSLANYHLLMLDEPTNHLDIDGKDELIDNLSMFDGGLILVSHDRELIEKSCNRFWYIDEGKLEEMSNIDNVYDAMMGEQCKSQLLLQTSQKTVVNSDAPSLTIISQDTLLDRLIALETLLNDDLSRKKKYQKIAMQTQWQAEMASINTQLELH